VMVIGEAIGPHAVLAGAIRFGPSGPIYQLFPVALIHALSALIAGRHLPKPPSGSPPNTPAPADTSEDVGIASAISESASQNGYQGLLSINSLGGLRLVDGSGDLTSALLTAKCWHSFGSICSREPFGMDRTRSLEHLWRTSSRQGSTPRPSVLVCVAGLVNFGINCQQGWEGE
jgi:hypothetical protein